MWSISVWQNLSWGQHQPNRCGQVSKKSIKFYILRTNSFCKTFTKLTKTSSSTGLLSKMSKLSVKGYISSSILKGFTSIWHIIRLYSEYESLLWLNKLTSLINIPFFVFLFFVPILLYVYYSWILYFPFVSILLISHSWKILFNFLI